VKAAAVSSAKPRQMRDRQCIRIGMGRKRAANMDGPSFSARSMGTGEHGKTESVRLPG